MGGYSKDEVPALPPAFLQRLRKAVDVGMGEEEIEAVLGLAAMMWELMEVHDSDFLIERCVGLVRVMVHEPCIRRTSSGRPKRGIDSGG